MAELLSACMREGAAGAAEEIADVVIVLYHLASSIGADLDDEIDHKMAANRVREWAGWYHVG